MGKRRTNDEGGLAVADGPPEESDAPAATLPFTGPPERTVDRLDQAEGLVAPHLAGTMPPLPMPAKSIRELVEVFISTIEAHPDAKMLSVRTGGTPSRHEALPGVPFISQNVISLRFVIQQ